MIATIIQDIYNNETVTTSSYKGFSILIRDKDNYINATKLINDINYKESIRKELRNITRSPEFKALEKKILDENEFAQFNWTHYTTDYRIISITK
jgi:hypothetical protein